MPKNKKNESSSDSSDTSIEDRNPPPDKKAKTKESKTKDPKAKEAPAQVKKPSASSGDQEEREWVLQGMKMVKVGEFRGRKSVHIREFYNCNGDIRPTKKGICLSALQWKKLLEYADEITKEVSDQ